jgi:nitroimidazol reductase NimA-like FMN-containing flavoprotein (pyridoxamine 5'-phosphate oxidase superfamily)
MRATLDLDLKQEVYWFLQTNRSSVIATSDSKRVPHAAMVYIIADQHLNIYFSTHAQGRKFTNLMTNPVVAMTIANEDSMTAVQLTGYASRVENLAEEQDVLYELLRNRYKNDPNWKPPPLKLFEQGETNEVAIIRVEPFELSLSNFELTGNGTKRYKTFFQTVI